VIPFDSTARIACTALALAACASKGDARRSVATCPVDAPPPAALVRDASPLIDPLPTRCQQSSSNQLSLPCLPRCALAIRDAFYACNDTTCEDDVLQTDTTPAVQVEGGSGSTPLDCRACMTSARLFCFSLACQVELAAENRCRALGTTTDCSREVSAVNTCVATHPAAYETCLFLAEDSCFSGH
jgi:hypothetical protein